VLADTTGVGAAVNVPGVTRDARKRARRRLGADLSAEQWACILADITDRRLASRPSEGGAVVYLVPLERDGSHGVLPVVVLRKPDADGKPRPVIVTVLPLEMARPALTPAICCANTKTDPVCACNTDEALTASAGRGASR
jgi:hypothetical protein